MNGSLKCGVKKKIRHFDYNLPELKMQPAQALQSSGYVLIEAYQYIDAQCRA